MKKTFVIVSVMLGIMMMACKPAAEEKNAGEADSLKVQSEVVAEEAAPVGVSLAQKVEEAKKRLSQEYNVLGDYNNVVYYMKRKGEYYEKKLYTYNVETETEDSKRLKVDGSGPAEYIHIADCSMKEYRIALIVEDGGRCGSGGALGNTFLKVYDVTTEKMKELTPDKDGCAGAEFTDNKTRIKMTVGWITNEDDDVCEADYIYDYKDQMVDF